MDKSRSTSGEKVENVVIIGGGPAGLAAGIYTARAGLNPLLFAGSPPGGQLMLTSEVENYPGFESILGGELIEKMRQQAKKFGAKIVDENVFEVNFSQRPFVIKTTGPVPTFPPASAHLDFDLKVGSLKGQNHNTSQIEVPELADLRAGGNPSSRATRLNNSFQTKSVIIATGAKALWLNVPGEQRLRGKGVSACATCDGFFFRDKIVAVIGGGDTALEEALTLTKFAKKVYIIHRRSEFRASKIMQGRVMKNSKIKIIFNAVVEEIIGKEKVERIKLKVKSQKLKVAVESLKLDGLFVAIGHKPDTEIFAGQLKLDSKGYIITSARKSIDNSKFLINLISNQLPNSNKPMTKNLDLDQLEIRNFDFNYQTATSTAGVFAAGDCVDYQYRQAGTAVGQGIAAALEVEKWLEKDQ